MSCSDAYATYILTLLLSNRVAVFNAESKTPNMSVVLIMAHTLHPSTLSTLLNHSRDCCHCKNSSYVPISRPTISSPHGPPTRRFLSEELCIAASCALPGYQFVCCLMTVYVARASVIKSKNDTTYRTRHIILSHLKVFPP